MTSPTPSATSDAAPVPVPEGDGSPHPTADRAPRDFGGQPVVTMPSGDPVPKLGLGTYQLDTDQAAELVEAALDLGMRHIDTAQMYGNEQGVGIGIERSDVARDDVFLTTKVDNHNHEPGDLVRSVEESLERLGTDHVDLLLIHWPVEIDRMAATLDTLAEVQASGRAHHIGVSNFTRAQLDRFSPNAPLEVLQVECHPLFQQHELRAWCVDHGWALTAYSPLAQGEVMDDETLTTIADEHGVTPAQISLAWLLAQPQVNTIPRTTSIDHLRSNWAALDVELSRDDLVRLTGADRDQRVVDPDFAPWR